ncbi:non ribosomal peptide synthase [Trichoderma sp. SZMC 28015]
MLSTAGLINQNAIEIPGAIACSQGGRCWTYRDLDAASQSLALLFRAHGVRAGDEIPIFLSRCFESVASTVALLRLGACFVPLDAESWGQGRIEQVLKAIGPNLVIYSTEIDFKAEGIETISAKEISASCQSLDYGTAPEHIVDVESNPDKPIYIIFTSGTTGIPKGVVIPRRCIDNYVRQGGDGGMPFNLGVCRGDRVLLLFSLGFDAAWGLILSEPGKVLDDAKRYSLGDPEAYQNIKFIFLGGESPNLAQVKRWSASHRRIYNCYGPTEATICAIVLGHPMTDTQLLILNEKLQVVSNGEIFIAGPGLATGFITWHGQRLYRTLDLGRKTMVKNLLSAAAFMQNAQLLAVITPEHINAATLRRFLSKKHDSFLLPRTPNGKASSVASGKEENSSELLREAVANALGFWELGGNSLLGIKLLSGLHRKGQTLIKKLEPAKLLESQSIPRALNGDPNKTEATAPMTPTQLGMSYMLIHIYLPWDPEMDSSRIRTAWRTVFERHSIFRTSFDPLNGIQRVGRQYTHDWAEIRVPADRLWKFIQHEEDSNDFLPVNALRLLVNQSGTAATLLWLIHHSLIDVHASIMGESLPDQPQQFWRLSQLLPRPFWRDLLSKVADVSPLNLPKPSQEGSLDGFGLIKVDFGIPLSVVQRICAANKLTPAATLHAAWTLLLRSYSSQNQLVFGTVFSGRDFPLPGIEEVVGPLLNTYELLAHWLAAEAMEKYMPGSHSRILETILFLEYDLPGLHDCEWRFDRIDRPEFGLTVSIRQEDANLCLRTSFDRSVYTEPVIRRMMSHFRNIFHAILDPRYPCEFLSLTSASPALMDPYTGVDQWPDAVAIESLTHSITYHELDQLGNYVAERITSLIQPGEAVAVFSDRSMDWVIAVIATIKAGAIYVPIDIKLPEQRFRIMLETSKAKLCIITSADSLQKYNDLFDMSLYVPDVLAGWDRKQSKRLETVTKPDDVAYITFTSGSTGVPKGVCIEHQSIVSYLSYGPSRMDARPGRRHAQMFSPGFDVNQAEIFGTLCYGATLVLYDPEDPFAHLCRVHATMITPSFLSVLDPASFSNLDTILFAGEAVPQALADRWARRRIVYNSYGPCECTIGCLIQPLQPQVEVTLGWAIPRVGVYILDEENRPVPIGVPGEICLSGIQVARGYIGPGTEDLSRTRFIPDPFVPGHHMYRTGDRAVWTEAMEPRFQGRFDNQVKVRGYRVELTEIENVIGMIDTNVRRVAAVVQGDIIIAFVEPSTVDVLCIQAGLQSRLPAYACPSKIVALPSLPTMPNQKLDRKKLQSYSSPTIMGNQKSSTFLQQLLIEAWKTAIGLPEETAINDESDFLALGGSSLSQLRMAQIVCGKLERKLPLKLFIWNTGFLALSDQIADYCMKEGANVSRTVLSEQPWMTLKPPFNATSHLEKELVLLSMSSPTPQTFNVAVQIRLIGIVDMIALENAVLAVTSSQPILRSCFRVEKETVVRCMSRTPCDIIREEQLNSDVVDNLANRPFDLFSGPLTRVLLGRNQGETTIVLIQHHAVTDKVAIKAFFRRVVIEYLHNIDKEKQERLEEVLSNPGYAAHESDIEYWRSQLSSGLVQYVGESNSFSLNWKRTSSSSMELFVTIVALALAEVKKTYDVPGTEDLLGVFLDRLPIRIHIPLQDSYDLLDFIQSVGELIRDALAHSISLKDIRDVTTHNELFQVMLVYNSLEDSISNTLSIPNVRTKFPLLLEFTEEPDSMVCRMEYMEHLLPSSIAITIGEAIANIWSRL